MKLREIDAMAKAVLPGAHEPDSQACYLQQFLDWLASHNYSPHTISDREASLRVFILWCAARDLIRPQDITKPILEYPC